MATLAELEDALQNASAAADAGDEEAAQQATQIADHITSLRGGGQLPDSVVPLDTGADPSAEEGPAPAPTHAGDVELTSEMRQWWDEGIRLEPGSEERGILEARFAGRLKAMGTGDGAGQASINAFSSFFDTPVNIGTAIGGKINEGINAVTGAVGVGTNFTTAKQALAMQAEFRKAQGEKFGKSQFAASLAGDIGTGAFIVKGGSKLIGKAGGKELVEKAAVFAKKKGGVGALSRLLLNSTVGAAEGAIVEGMRTGSAITGATLGLINGPAGEGLALLGKVTSALTPSALKEIMRAPEAKALRKLAEMSGNTHKELAERWARFSTIFGRPPSMAELTDDAASLELAKIVVDSKASADIARKGIQGLQDRSSREMSEAITGGATPATVARQTAAQTKVADKMFKEVRTENFEFDGDAIEALLEDGDLKRLFPARIGQKIKDDIASVTDEDTGEIVGSVFLDGTTVDRLRKALAKKADFSNTGNDFPEHFADLGDALNELAGEQSEIYASALEQFGRRSSRIEGLKSGGRIRGAKPSEFVEEAKLATDADFRAGQRQGIRKSLADDALGGPAAASRVGSDLADDVGLQDRLVSSLPDSKSGKLTEVGNLKKRADANLRTLDPGMTQIADDLAEEARDLGIATLPGIPIASRALAMTRLMNKMHGIDKRVAKNMANDLFDPTKSRIVIDLMLERGFKEADIRAIFVAGQAAGSAVTQADE